MNELGKAISQMDFKYFGTGQHKASPESLLTRDDALILDVRSQEETDTVKLSLKHHCDILEIPTHEVPARIGEIPRDKTIGVFCSSSVRSVIIFTYLRSLGYDAKVLEGGYVGFLSALMPGKIYKKING